MLIDNSFSIRLHQKIAYMESILKMLFLFDVIN